jgi:hypothetical protein
VVRTGLLSSSLAFWKKMERLVVTGQTCARNATQNKLDSVSAAPGRGVHAIDVARTLVSDQVVTRTAWRLERSERALAELAWPTGTRPCFRSVTVSMTWIQQVW